MESITRVLRRRRHTLGLSRAEVVSRLQERGVGISTAAYGHWEGGRRRPSVAHLAALASLLEFEPADCAEVLGAPTGRGEGTHP